MKRIYLKLLFLFLALVIISPAMAQDAEPFNYQAVIRKADGAVVQNQQVTVTFSIQSNGGVLYSEKHNPTTDAYGVINKTVGTGSVVSGVFDDIDWSQDLTLVVAIDYDGDGADDLSGSSEIMAVPKAGFAQKASVADELSYDLADVATSGDFNDLTNKPNLNLTGNELSIDGGNTVDLSPILSGGANQELSLSGYVLSISDGNSVNLSGIDSDSQTLSISGNTLSISGGNSVSLPTGSGTGDMLQSVYDSNNDGVVDNADNAARVNNLTVETAVPSGAVFTDDQDATEVSLSGYVKPASGGAILANDDIQTAIGKLEKDLENATAVGGDPNVQVDWNVTDTGSDAFILNKPTLGTAAGLDVGTAANNVVQLDASGMLPALDGSNLTNLPSGSSLPSGTSGQSLRHDGTDWAASSLISDDGTDITTSGDLNVGGGEFSTARIDLRGSGDGNLLIRKNAISGGDKTVTFKNETGTVALLSDITDDQNAGEVGVTASGNLTSTNVQAALEELQADIDAGSSGGDMLQSAYDSNSDGTVDNADNAARVNNLTVDTAVPSGAVFTDNQNATEVSLSSYTKPASTSAIGASDDIQTAIGKLEKGLESAGGSSLPSGTSGQSLRHDGTDWAASSLISDDGTDITTSGDLNVGGGEFSTARIDLRGSGDGNLLIRKQSISGGDKTATFKNETGTVALLSDITDDQDATEVSLSGYTKPASTTAIGASDDVQTAIGKLEKGLESAGGGGGSTTSKAGAGATDADKYAFVKSSGSGTVTVSETGNTTTVTVPAGVELDYLSLALDASVAFPNNEYIIEFNFDASTGYFTGSTLADAKSWFFPQIQLMEYTAISVFPISEASPGAYIIDQNARPNHHFYDMGAGANGHFKIKLTTLDSWAGPFTVTFNW